jgi:predicted nucleotidyltransferase component of viral defense system
MAASVSRRLLNHAHSVSADPNLILLWYALERLLYRLSVSPHVDRFVLKGAMLFRLWGGDDFRATRDLDLLSFLKAEQSTIRDVFINLCLQAVPDDGLSFDPASVQVTEIREHQEYGGLRVKLTGRLGNARIPLQVDVGFGDAITPAAVDASFPTLLGLPAPKIRAYPKETVIAEKFEAIATLGITNSRVKDYYDIWMLSRRYEFDPAVLGSAIRATFQRRGTPLPVQPPVGLTAAYASDPGHQSQWRAFVTRNLQQPELQERFSQVVSEVAKFVMQAVRQ